MDTQGKITVRVAEKYRKLFEDRKDSDVVNEALETKINPKVVDTSTGEIAEMPNMDDYVFITPQMKVAMDELRYRLDKPINDFGAELIWQQIKFQKKYANAPAKTSTTSFDSPNPTDYETSGTRLIYWQKTISETPAWDEIGAKQNEEGIKADPFLTEKDRAKLTGKRK